MSGWIITRGTKRLTEKPDYDVRYRRKDGRLVADPSEAKVYPSASAALAAAQEGDVIEQASSLNTSA